MKSAGSPFRNRKCLVIGANSFLAREIILALKDDNDVTGIYHERSDKLLPGVSALRITEIDKLRDEYDYIFLISAYISNADDLETKEKLEQVNVKLPEMICSQFPSAKIIFASTVSVYGAQNEAVSEASATESATAYGMSKLAGERIIRKHPQFAIVRISSMYGTGMNTSTFLPRIIDDALAKGCITLYGDGSRLQNYIQVSDAAEIFIRSARSDSNNTYLAVGKKSFSNGECASFVRSVLPGTEIRMTGSDHSPSFTYDASLSYELLDFEPGVKITEGIEELVKWRQKKS
ncbi:MAG: NAD-dependent epimerase/dehydratase family protein [Bacteroidia bacterium]